MADEKSIVLKIETITDQAVMEAYGKTLNEVLGSYEDNIALITQYNAQIKANSEQIKAIEKESERWGKTTQKQADTVARLTAENNKLKQAKAELVQITKNQEKIDTSIAGTMENQSQILGKLREAWRLMTDEQKEANSGLLETIQQLDAALKEEDAEIGNFQRNVGNYAGGIAQALARLDILPDTLAKNISAIGNLQNGVKKLSTTIGGGALGAIKGFAGAAGLAITAIQGLFRLVIALKERLDKTDPERKAKIALEEYNAEIAKTTAQGSADKITRLKELAYAYAEIGDNASKRKKFVAEYKEELRDMGIEVENVNDADRVLISQTGAYVSAMVARAKADAIRRKASKDYEKALEDIAAAERKAKQASEELSLAQQSGGINVPAFFRTGTEYLVSSYGSTVAIDGAKEKLKNALNEVKELMENAEKGLNKSFEDAAAFEKEANKYLKKGGKSKDKGSKGGKTEAEKEAERAKRVREQELEDIAKANREAELALLDAESRELQILEDEYNEKKAAFEKHEKDMTLLTQAYEAEKAAIEKKYAEKRAEQQEAMFSQLEVVVKEFEADIEAIVKDLKPLAESPVARAFGITDEELKKINQQALQAAGRLFNSIAQISNNATKRRLEDDLDAVDREAESEKAILEAKLEKGLISQKEYEKKLGELDEETAARKEELNKEAFQKQKAWNIGQALMNAALAITQVFATTPPPASFLMAAITAATTAAEIGVIASQKYARGGELHGASHANGGIKGFVGNRHIEAEGGEVIINKRSSAKHRKLLSLINSDNGWGDDFAHVRGGSGRFFARGGVIGGYDFRTSGVPSSSSSFSKVVQQQTDNLRASFDKINQRIDNIRVSVLLSDIEAKSNEKRVHISRAVL